GGPVYARRRSSPCWSFRSGRRGRLRSALRTAPVLLGLRLVVGPGWLRVLAGLRVLARWLLRERIRLLVLIRLLLVPRDRGRVRRTGRHTVDRQPPGQLSGRQQPRPRQQGRTGTEHH